jgi:DMSO/TMAO reductase YedYZ molybdopterin-dependent catalytic subunit
MLRAAEAGLAIRTEVETPVDLSLSEIKYLPLVKAPAKEHNCTTATYGGVSLAGLLRRAGVPQGKALHGQALELSFIVKAADGYQTRFALAELDPAMTGKIVLLAFICDGASLDAAAGPLRIIIPDEKRQARWVRLITELEVVWAGTAKPTHLQPGK